MQLPTVGQLFEGQYLLESLLGEGGFGMVFGAVDPNGRQVALKVVKPDEGATYSRKMRARFEREVAVLAGLKSPHTVQLYTHGQSAGGLLYMLFEYIPGRDLTEYLRAVGRLDPKWVAHIMRQVLLALDEAHRAGLIHRDLKPDNIRIFESGGDAMAVKLLDFGIARATDDGHPSITKTGELIGTPRYMSPEQLKAQPLTPRSDIYSLGMVAIELLAGEDALSGSTIPEQLQRLVGSDDVHTPVLAERAGPLLDVVRKMTALEPGERYPSAAAVLNDIDPSRRAPAPIAATATDVGQPPRYRMLAGVAALVAVAVLVLVFWPAESPERPPPTTVTPSIVRQANIPAEPEAQPRDLGRANADLAGDLGGDAASTVDLPALQPRIPRPSPTSGCRRGKMTAGAHQVGPHTLYVPRGYDHRTPHPVVLLLHMDRQDPQTMLETSRWREHADEHGFVILAAGDHSAKQWRVWREADTDLDDVLAFLREQSRRLCLDRSRTFVLGVADGGRVARLLACEPEITAVAMSSYLLAEVEETDWCLDQPIPVMSILPANSPQIPIDGSGPCDNFGGTPSATLEQIEQRWTKKMFCSGPRPWGDPERASCTSWACHGDSVFVSCVAPGGIGWAGTHIPLPLLCDDEPAAPAYPAEEELWQFFIDAPPQRSPAK